MNILFRVAGGITLNGGSWTDQFIAARAQPQKWVANPPLFHPNAQKALAIRPLIAIVRRDERGTASHELL
jgi:hypothetical protein